ncbi:MAG: DUF2175 family protein [Candidatus Thermoplasmatota archaeon]|nr:DUF2175 family protein [Candidatus Thermoplasmatota archaeon]MCL5437648.1 DUF2175 family protein [Candidatus Thermoplasmatota archaeon]
MAEFNCYVCTGKVRTGEKFTFTRKGAVHFDCFISSRRTELKDEKHEELRTLSILLDSQLKYLLDILLLGKQDGGIGDYLNSKYKEIEAGCGETTRLISDL